MSTGLHKGDIPILVLRLSATHVAPAQLQIGDLLFESRVARVVALERIDWWVRQNMNDSHKATSGEINS
jgi:hypothetical protein